MTFNRAPVDLFDSLAPDEVEDLLQKAQRRRVPAETRLFSEGSPARAIHVLASGYVRMVQTTANGARVITRYVQPGEAFGISAVVDGDYPADAVTVTTSVELQWSAQVMKDLVGRSPRFALNIIQDLELRLRDMESRMRDLSNEPVEQRIAHALARLVTKFGEDVPDGVEIPFPLSRQDLADLAGTTLHTVSRTLGGWEAQGRIKRGRRRVIVTDIAGLKQLAAPGSALEPRSRRTHRRLSSRQAKAQ